MGIRDDIQTELAASFSDELEDVVVEFTLMRPSAVGSYDPESGTRQRYPSEFESRGIFSAYKTEKIDGTRIKIGDEKLIIIANEIETTPLIDDEILLIDKITLEVLTKYLVKNVKSVMAGGSTPITYTLQVRKNA